MTTPTTRRWTPVTLDDLVREYGDAIDLYPGLPHWPVGWAEWQIERAVRDYRAIRDTTERTPQ